MHRSIWSRKMIAPALLLLILCACSSPSGPELPGSSEAPPPQPGLSSPLLAQADLLAAARPGKNHVSLIDIGNDALLLRVHLIRSARRSIAVQTMIWDKDECGRLVMYELMRAAQRGVMVQVLVDHLASEQDVDIAYFLAHAHPNLQVRLFNPLPGLFGQLKAEPSLLDRMHALVFRFKRLNQRMHNKTFIIDDKLGITGGRNYQNAYYDQSTGMNFKDRDLLVVGPVAREMRDSFDQFWNYPRAVPLSELKDVKSYRKQGLARNPYSKDGFALGNQFDNLDRDADRPELIARRFAETLAEVDHAYFVADEPHKSERWLLNGDDQSRIIAELAGMVASARQSIYIQTPYLVLTSKATALFRNLREQHPLIDIRISTNSLAATDSWPVYALSYKQKKTYLRTLGFIIYEFKPVPGDLRTFIPDYDRLKARFDAAAAGAQQQHRDAARDDWNMAQDLAATPYNGPYLCLHAKTLVVDEEVAFIGSYNLDPRSENLNTECGVVIRDKSFARRLQNRIRVDMLARNAWVVARKNRPLPINEANALVAELSHLIPLVDVWPIRYSASFELLDGKQEVDPGHTDFYRNYRDVGNFPLVRSRNLPKEVGTRGTKAFLSFVKPLL